MVRVTAPAAERLRELLRLAGAPEPWGVRVRGGGERVELTVEDRPEPGDEINEDGGIRFYVDDTTASAIGSATLDCEGGELVLRVEGSG